MNGGWSEDCVPLPSLIQTFPQPAKPPLRKDVGPMYSYVALYKFLPQENNDLALQ